MDRHMQTAALITNHTPNREKSIVSSRKSWRGQLDLNQRYPSERRGLLGR